MNIAIIPARGGSKRIPHKNIKEFCGKPMITYSIEAAKESNCFDRIIVSTDDLEIADIARECGAEIPFIRPAAISDDYSTTTEVIQHAITELELDDSDFICCIYATAPFLKAHRLLEGHTIILNSNLDYVFSATEYSFPIQRAFRLTETNRVEMYQPENFKTRSQDFEKAFHDAGQFYWGRCIAFKKGNTVFSNSASPLILPAQEVQDIDTSEDWERAIAMYKMLASSSVE